MTIKIVCDIVFMKSHVPARWQDCLARETAIQTLSALQVLYFSISLCLEIRHNEERMHIFAERFVPFILKVEHSGLVCGKENCQGTSYDNTDDCCMLPDGGRMIRL